MSTAANETPETLGPLANGMGWFQLYPPRNANMRNDLLARARDSGFTTLLLTVDVPAISRRERQMHAGLGGGVRPTPGMVRDAVLRPAWLMAMLAAGRPGLPTMEKYLPSDKADSFLAFVGEELNGTLDWNYVAQLRESWDGPLVLKGILHPADALQAVEQGVNGILVSNHGGRQLDGALTSIEALPAIADAVGGRATLLLDSGGARRPGYRPGFGVGR